MLRNRLRGSRDDKKVVRKGFPLSASSGKGIPEKVVGTSLGIPRLDFSNIISKVQKQITTVFTISEVIFIIT